MKLHLVCFVYVILGIRTNSSDKTALSSCLNMLQYQRDVNGWFGLVQVQSPNATKTLKLELLLSLPGQLPSEKVEFIENIRPICLWEGDQSLEGIVGQFGTVAGWGGNGVNSLLTPEPKSIKMPIVSDVDCLRSSEAYRYITSQRTFCAGSRDGLGPCKRDEGSGMILKVNNKWMLRGIVSYILSDPNYQCNLNDYVVFTDAAKFVSWIVSFL
ncbi:hypothetical protein HA402_013748 [Bradysia odoriphaga]|nr:hypothetical protein HA402_013748 [Bradysia odoriphaga]